jgi:hypothetical protein
MSSGCSRSATHRPTNACCRSSIASKCDWPPPPRRASTAFLRVAVPGNGRAGTPSVSLLAPQFPLGRVPPGTVERQQDAFSLSRSYLPGEVLQSHREHFGVYGGKDEPMDLPAVGVRESLEVGPLVSLVDPNERPLTDRTPYLAHDRLEAQALLILAPELHLRRGPP